MIEPRRRPFAPGYEREFRSSVIRMTARALFPLFASVQSAIALDSPRDLPVAIEAQNIHRFATKAMAFRALRRSVQLAVCPRERAGRDLRTRRCRDGDDRGRDKQDGNSHSSRSRVSCWHR
jgi:hypothetical protein